MLIAAPLLALATLLPQHGGDPVLDRRPTPVYEDPGTPTVSELEAEIDRSLRWLRTQQNEESGGYGDDSAFQTATVLSAFARSHRAYRQKDGPFVAKAIRHLMKLQRDDGAFPDGELQRTNIQATTATVVAALESLELTGEETMHRRAVTYLGKSYESYSALHTPRVFETVAEARILANEVLARRSENGSWADGFLSDGPSVLRTARATLELCDVHARLKAEPSAPSPKIETKPLPPLSPASRQEVTKALELGAAFLIDAAKDGRWGAMGRDDAGITAMVMSALLTIPEPRGERLQSAIDGGLDWLGSLQKEDGSIHDGQLANYVTSASILAFVKAGREQDKPRIERARGFLTLLQADEGEGYDPTHHFYGGVGYGGDERPDLSNLQMALEALAAAGLEQGDPAFVKALRFLERSQNRSESNDISLTEGVAEILSGDDGGGTYAPGESKAGLMTLADGTQVPRSYGSMTYALLKGYLFAGLPREDPRVEAAWQWLRKNYTLDINPGFEASSDPASAYQGLFYYFYTMARALALYGETLVVDSAGTEHDWRSDLTRRLAVMQRQDGSWINENSPRWWEGNPVLATAYAMLTLDVARGEAASGEK